MKPAFDRRTEAAVDLRQAGGHGEEIERPCALAYSRRGKMPMKEDRSEANSRPHQRERRRRG